MYITNEGNLMKIQILRECSILLWKKYGNRQCLGITSSKKKIDKMRWNEEQAHSEQ
jgi:hypothetical protein